MTKDIFTQESHLDYELLNARDCLTFLTKKEQEALINNKTDLKFDANEIIIKRGSLANNLAYLTDGLVKLEIVNNGSESTVAILQPNSFIGIVCCFAFKKFDFTATALTKTKVSFIDLVIFERFIKNNGDFALNLIRHMSGVSNRLLHRLTTLAQKNVEGSLSYILLDFGRIFSSDEFELPVSRIELGNMLGYSKESVINTLSKFNKEGIIRVDDKRIRIIQKEKLKQICKLG